VRTLVKRKQITDVGPLLDKEDAAWRKANYSDSVLALGKVDGKTVRPRVQRVAADHLLTTSSS
jgi:hypothetical protein